MLRTTQRRAGARPAGARGHLKYAVAYHRPGSRLGTSRLSGAWIRPTWWHRLADDRDLVGAKLLLLAALLALTALLERVV